MHLTHRPTVTLLIAAISLTAAPALAGGRTTAFRETVELIVGHGSREFAEKAARASADDAVELVLRQAVDADGLTPVVRAIGPEALQLQAKAPGIAERVVATFGPDGARKLATTVPAEDLPRLVAYADRADTAATRQALLAAYEKEGPSLFHRIPPKLVFAGGLTAAMVYGTHRATAPLAALGDQIRRDPRVATRALDTVALVCSSAVLLVIAGVTWRVRHSCRHPASPPATDLDTRATRVPGAVRGGR